MSEAFIRDYVRTPIGRYGCVLFAAAVSGMLFFAIPPGVADTPVVTDRHVVIERDEYGVPQIYARSAYGLFYGYGYAVAQDRLFQMEMAKRSTQGRVAEVLGEAFVGFDKATRSNYWPASIERQVAALPQSDRDILDGYAAGMNAWITKVRSNASELLPKQFKDFGFAPSIWSAFDVAMVFIGTMANRFSDASGEIDNLALLTQLKDRYGTERAAQLFDQLKWLTNLDARTTIPQSEGHYPIKFGAASQPDKLTYNLPRYDGRPPMLERLALGAGGELLNQSEDGNRETLLRQLTQFGQTGSAGFQTHSNMWIVGRDKARNAKAIMLNGPQFGWFVPAYTYGVGLHGPGYDIVGNTPFAYPCILFGHNGRVAWGSTAGFGDDVDIFLETLDPQDATHYRHNGEWLQMERRTDRIAVKDSEPIVLDVYRTVHGIVVKTDSVQHVAYSKARAWDGLEVQSLMAWTHQGQATDWPSWIAEAERQALTINWYYADHDGNIGYVHTGKYPDRRPGHDPRLPVPGTGEWDWRGLLPFSANPKVYNPAQGYIINWNNAPEAGYPATDLYSILWGEADRVSEIEDRLKQYKTLDIGDMWSLLRSTSLADVNVRHFLPFIRQAVGPLPAVDERKELLDLLNHWNGLNENTTGNGYYDNPGSAVMDAWLTAMLRRTLGQVLPADLFKWYASSGYATPERPPAGSINIAPGTKILYEALLGPKSGVPQRFDIFLGQSPDTVVLGALDDALIALKKQYGNDIRAWKVPVVPLAFLANNFLGVPQADQTEAKRGPIFLNRGTENDLIAFDSQGVQALDVVAPGQSGYVTLAGERSGHYEDQFGMYNEFGRKRIWLNAADVERTTRLREEINY